MAPLVAGVSVERIHNELSRAFTEGEPARAYTLLALTGLLDAVLPEADWLGSNVAAKLHSLGGVPFAVCLASILGDTTPEQGADVVRRLKGSKQERERVAYLLAGRRVFDRERTRAETIRFIRQDDWPLLARLVRAERVSRGADPGDVDALIGLRESLAPDEIHPPRLLGGNDLQALGLRPGPHFKQLLNELEDEQLEGRVTTREEAEAFVLSRAG